VRLGLTIVAAALTHSSGILVGAIMMRFGNEKESEEERDPIEQDRGSSHRRFDNTSGVQLNSSSEAPIKNKANAKRTIMYKAGLGVATVFLSLILTGCFHRNAQFPVVCNPSVLLTQTES
jgi:2-hydroxychromene-2-carboxylate isomerase